MSEPLFDVVTVWCFFNCNVRYQRATPEDAHAAMEAHYREAHSREIRDAVSWLVAS